MTPDRSLSDLSDEIVERIANEVALRAQWLAKAGDYYGATNLATGAQIIRDWLEKRYDREVFPASGSLHESNGGRPMSTGAKVGAPVRIYIQDNGDYEDALGRGLDLTWGEDRINPRDTAYVRADIADDLLAALKGLVEAAEREFDTRRCAEGSLRRLNAARAAIARAVTAAGNLAADWILLQDGNDGDE